MDIGKTRKNYKSKNGIFNNNRSPFLFFKEWYKEAEKKVSEPNAFALSTSSKNKTSSRMMLLKDFSNTFTFYTNTSSKKGRDILTNKAASMLFWWKELEQQIRIEGTLSQLSTYMVKKYFYSRPKDSQIAALSSDQSSQLESYNHLIEEFDTNKKKYSKKRVPFPKDWVGFELKPQMIEFWQGGPNRLHQRIEYKKIKDIWEARILAP